MGPRGVDTTPFIIDSSIIICEIHIDINYALFIGNVGLHLDYICLPILVKTESE